MLHGTDHAQRNGYGSICNHGCYMGANDPLAMQPRVLTTHSSHAQWTHSRAMGVSSHHRFSSRHKASRETRQVLRRQQRDEPPIMSLRVVLTAARHAKDVHC